MKLAKFLDKYDTVIFDMDGVITSEQNYWNCAALTVWEYLNYNSGQKINAAECMQNISKIRSHVFSDDELISVLKGKGVNSNWDLGYVTVLIAWICNGKNDWNYFDKVLEYAKPLSDNIIDEYNNLAIKCAEKTGFDYEWLKRNGTMWTTMRDIFQTWFLDELFKKTLAIYRLIRAKRDFYKEEPIVDKNKLITIMSLLSRNKRVCTGTGRPYIEMLPPIENWGIKQYFAKTDFAIMTMLSRLKKELNNNALTKPHPYMFLKALYGTDYSNKRIVDGDYDKAKIKTTLVVGDAGAIFWRHRRWAQTFVRCLREYKAREQEVILKTWGELYFKKV